MNLNRSTIRTIDILDLLVSQQRPLSLSEISRALNIPKSTTYQIVHTLASIRVLESDSRTYRPGIRFFEMALLSFDRMDLRREARGIMEELSSEFGETVFLATHDRGEIVYLDQVEGPSPMRLSVTVGARAPMHCSALGKSILSAVPEDRVREISGGGNLPQETEFTIKTHHLLMKDIMETQKRGYALDEQEHIANISCAAAPVRNGSGNAVGAVSVVGHTSRLNGDRLNHIGQHVKKAALMISRRLGYGGNNLYPNSGFRSDE